MGVLEEIVRMVRATLESSARTIRLCLLLAVATPPLGIVALTVYLIGR